MSYYFSKTIYHSLPHRKKTEKCCSIQFKIYDYDKKFRLCFSPLLASVEIDSYIERKKEETDVRSEEEKRGEGKGEKEREEIYIFTMREWRWVGG